MDKRPIWIVADIFEGHQGHWADCFFSNAIESEIRDYLEDEDTSYVIREMTDEELTKYPEAVEFQKYLMETYGEV